MAHLQYPNPPSSPLNPESHATLSCSHNMDTFIVCRSHLHLNPVTILFMGSLLHCCEFWYGRYHTWHNLCSFMLSHTWPSLTPKRELQILTINSRSLQLVKLNGRSYFKYSAGTLMIYGFTDIWSSKSCKIKQLSYGLRELENVILSYLAQKLRQSL